MAKWHLQIVTKSLLILKIKINSESKQKIDHLITEFNAVILDDSIESYTIQLTGKIEEIDGFVSKISTLDISDIQSYIKYWLYIVTKTITTAIPTDI